MRKTIINGANGYVASHFIKELADNKLQVKALVRGSETASAKERMETAMAKTGAGKNSLDNIQVLDYKLNEKDFALSKSDLGEIFGNDTDFFHFAASLKFSTKDKTRIFKTNVKGLENAISSFIEHAGPGSRFFYISTVYSCGIMEGTFKEKFYPDAEIGQFRNYYEQSKRFAENTLKKYIDNDKLNAHIIRLAQVVGHSKTGVTATDYGVFDLAKRLQSLAASYPNETVRIKIDPDATQNIIAIDTVARYLRETSKLKDLPTIINFSGKSYIKNRFIAECLNQRLPIEIKLDKTLKPTQLNPLERIIAAGMKFTGVYANTELHFDRSELEKLIDTRDEKINNELFCKMLEYFFKNHRTK